MGGHHGRHSLDNSYRLCCRHPCAVSYARPEYTKGFIVTTVLGIGGAFLATAVGDATGLYRPGQGAGLIGATVGSLAILFIWNRLVVSRIIRDHGI